MAYLLFYFICYSIYFMYICPILYIMKKDYPSYTNLYYYYNNKKVYDVLKHLEFDWYLGSLIYCENGDIFFTNYKGLYSLQIDDHLRYDYVYPDSWLNYEQLVFIKETFIKYGIENINDLWSDMFSTYTNDFLVQLQNDIKKIKRQVKLSEISDNNFLKSKEWIKY
jgi:hypothetical protein